MLGFRSVHEEGSTRRFAVGDAGPGTLVDVRSLSGFFAASVARGQSPVAWRVSDDDAQMGRVSK